MAYRDPAQGRAADRARFRKRTAERKAAGLCPRCGERRPEDGLALCSACAEKRRASERARDARRRAAGVKRRRNPASERARDRRRTAERIARGLCTECSTEPAAPARRLCAGCGERRRDADRARYTEAKARGEKYGGKDPNVKRKAARTESAKRRQARLDAGTCTRCGRRPPVEGGTVCGQPAYGACRCPECAKRSYERSAHFRGIPVWEPTFEVIELDTGTVHGPFDSEAAASLVFAKLSLHEVEIVSDAPITATVTGWS